MELCKPQSVPSETSLTNKQFFLVSLFHKDVTVEVRVRSGSCMFGAGRDSTVCSQGPKTEAI